MVRKKTDSIIEDAWRRYAEIVDENADEPKKMYMHTRKRIYPAIAAFDAMTGNGISREEAAAFLNRYYEKSGQRALVQKNPRGNEDTRPV